MWELSADTQSNWRGSVAAFRSQRGGRNTWSEHFYVFWGDLISRYVYFMAQDAINLHAVKSNLDIFIFYVSWMFRETMVACFRCCQSERGDCSIYHHGCPWLLLLNWRPQVGSVCCTDDCLYVRMLKGVFALMSVCMWGCWRECFLHIIKG